MWTLYSVCVCVCVRHDMCIQLNLLLGPIRAATSSLALISSVYHILPAARLCISPLSLCVALLKKQFLAPHLLSVHQCSIVCLCSLCSISPSSLVCTMHSLKFFFLRCSILQKKKQKKQTVDVDKVSHNPQHIKALDGSIWFFRNQTWPC